MRKSQATFLNWVQRQPAWKRLQTALAWVKGPPAIRQHKPWSGTHAREKARRVRQAERIAEKRAKKGEL